MSRTIGTGGIAMLLLLSLAAIGVGIALWSKVLTIQGIVSTGSVNAEYARVFTDDDDFVDDPAFDELDTGDCAISVGPDDSPFGPENDKDEPDGITSCDPSETGADPKPHYNKDVARCDAVLRDSDPDQEGDQGVAVAITNGYPSYHCTAWLFIRNTGSIPVLMHSVQIGGLAAFPCQLGSTPYDLDGDGAGDLEICVSGFDCIPNDGNRECEEPQIDPGDGFVMDLDMHVMQTAPQNATLTFDAEVCLHQWNEETGNCPQPKVLLYYGNGGVTPASGSLSLLKSHYEVLGYEVDYTNVWPADLSDYGLVYINAPGAQDDTGVNNFSGAQKAALSAYMADGGRVVVAGDHSGFFGIATLNDLLAAISGNISQNADLATPDGDICAPLTDITADAVTAGLASIDPSATSSLAVGGPAVSLARVDPAPFDCDGHPLGVINDATYLARDGQLVVIGDTNTLDDFGLSDPEGDGSNYGLATNLLTY